MTSLADSSALKNRERLLPQHQAALTLLQERLSNPDCNQLSWLDLACGKGQIIIDLDNNLSEQARARINFMPYDIDLRHARETSKTAEGLGFASLNSKHGDLSDLSKIIPADILFDFITLTNTVHEVSPADLSTIFVDCILRLEGDGTLFIYDMEQIRPPELGSIPWTRDEVRSIIHAVIDGLCAGSYRPEVCRWKHRTCNAWSVQLERKYLDIASGDGNSKRQVAINKGAEEITSLLARKLQTCRKSLETLTLYGAETPEEKEERERLVYEFWAVSRALEGV